MNLRGILERLAREGVQLWADGDAIRIRGRKSALTDELQTVLRAHKPEVLALLRAQADDTIAGSSAHAAQLPAPVASPAPMPPIPQPIPRVASAPIQRSGAVFVPKPPSATTITATHKLLPAALTHPPADAALTSSACIAPTGSATFVGHVPSDAPAPASYPLSAEQRRLWFIHRTAPDSAAYNVHFGVRVDGPLDEDAAHHALRSMVARHELLRTVYRDHAGTPAQVILPDSNLEFELVDASAAGDYAVDRLVARLAARPFDLSAAPPVRAYHIRRGPERHILLFVLHHILTDWWSVTVFLREFAAVYRGEPLAPGPLQYRDYACWQARRSPVLDRDAGWWAQHLADLSPLHLASEHLPDHDEAQAGATLPFTVPADLTADLRALGQREGCTLFIVLLAAFAALLHRHTRQSAFAVGSVLANRDRRELQEAFGFFANTVALRCDLHGRPGFRGLLTRLRDSTYAAFAHGEVPFDLVVNRLRAGKARQKPFAASLVLESFAPPDLGVPSWQPLLQVSSGSSEGAAKFDLGLVLGPSERGGLTGAFEYATARFSAAAVGAMRDQWLTLLRAAVAEPDRAIDELPLMSVDTAAGLLAVGEGPAAHPPVPLHALFEAQAARTPDAIAVVHGPRRISYRELDTWSDRLAGGLQRLGAARGAVVGLLLPRGVDMVAAILATLKTGAAYLPLDPGATPARLGRTVRDAGCVVVVADADREQDLGAPLVRLERLSGRPRAHVLVDPDDDAYIIYTSGSTGTPKGAAIPHRAASNTVQALADARRISAMSRVLHAAPPIFDASVPELFATLARGACLVIPPPAAALPGPELIALLRRTRVTHLATTASFLAVCPRASLPDLAVITVGGETCPRDLAAWWATGRRMLCEYGVTEASVTSTWTPLDPTQRAAVIGAPLPGARVYVLDEHLAPVPPGVPGELFIGGAGVARGYPGRPDLTATRFLPDPFAREPGARMYRTGDCVRWRPDAPALEFLGRLDHQVKIRGVRVELAEVEAILAEHPHVQRCVVTLAHADGDPRLLAHVVPTPGATLVPEQLRAHMLQFVPAVMVPARFLVLADLPSTPTGKVDRAALPHLEPSNTSTPTVDLDDPRAADIIALWRELLAVPHLSPDDDFFALGGHSLLAVHMLAQLAQRFDATVPIAEFLRWPTIRGLIHHIGRGVVREPTARTLLVRPAGRTPVCFVPPFDGSANVYEALASRLTDVGSVHALEGRLGLASLEIGDFAGYFADRAAELAHDGALQLVGWSFGGLVAVELARQLRQRGIDVPSLVLLDAWAPWLWAGVDPDPLRMAAAMLGVTDGPALGADADARLAALARQTVAAGKFASLAIARRALRQMVETFYSQQLIAATLSCQLYPGRVCLLRAEVPWIAHRDDALGWRTLAGNLEVHAVPGDHWTMLQPPHVETLARRLTTAVQRQPSPRESHPLSVAERRHAAPQRRRVSAAWRT